MFGVCSADGSQHCSQAVTQQSTEVMAVRLGDTARQLQAELDGFKSRALRAEAPAQRHLYMAEWRVQEDVQVDESELLMLAGHTRGDLDRQSINMPVTHRELARRMEGGAPIVATAATASQEASDALSAVAALEATFTLVLTQATAVPTPAL